MISLINYVLIRSLGRVRWRYKGSEKDKRCCFMSQENKTATLHCCLVSWMLTVCCLCNFSRFLRIITSATGRDILGGTAQSFPKQEYFYHILWFVSFPFKTIFVFLLEENRTQRRCTILRMSFQDSRNRAEGNSLSQLLPVLSSEQAVSLQEGQEIVGTRRISAAPATSPRKLLPQHNVTNSGSSKGGVKQPKRKLENNEEVDVTPLPLERLRVGAPDPAGVRVCSLKLIDKSKAQFPR